jgi:hypothetical protein
LKNKALKELMILNNLNNNTMKPFSKISFSNTSNSKLRTVAKVAIPTTLSLPKYPFVSTKDALLPLVFEKRVGDITNIYTARGGFNPGITLGEIVEGPEDLYDKDFKFTDWVLADVMGNLLRVVITLNNGESITLPFSKIESVVSTAHVQTFQVETPVVNGWRAIQYLRVLNGCDHIEFMLGLNWHDRSEPNYATTIASVRLECKSEFVIHFHDQMQLPKINYQPMVDLWYMDVVPNGAFLRDGQGFELRGYVLTMPENFINSDTDGVITERVENIAAIKTGKLATGGLGEVNGVYTDLNHGHNWFNRHLPAPTFKEDPLKYPLFSESGIFGARRIGSVKNPGQTGGQEDFGADKGFEATVFHNAEWIQYMKGGQADRLRFFNIHEPDGSKVTKENHPLRKTWNMETFPPLSQDLLGKNPATYNDGNGWKGYDNQHRSQNNLLTYYALTGDELTLDTLINAVEQDFAQARNLSLADREVGRMFNCWAKMLRVLPEAYANKLKDHCNVKVTEFLSDWRGRFPEIQQDPNRTVRVLQVIIDPRSGVVNPATNKIEPTWIPYQTAQLCQGLYSLSLELNDNRILPVLKDLLKTFLLHGCFNQDNTWYVVIFARYLTGLESGRMINPLQFASDEGIPLQPSEYHVGNWQIQVDQQYNHGWWDWAAPCVAISKLILDEETLKQRATEILQWAYPQGVRTIQSASWFATPV